MNDIIIFSPKNPIAFHFFNFPVRYYGLCMCFAIFFGVILSYIVFKKKYSKSEADLFLDIIPGVILFSIIGARFFYVLSDLKDYLKNPLEIIMINHGGLSIFGGLTFGIIYFYFISRAYKINFFKYADVISVSLPISQAIGRFGNFFNQEAYGKPAQGLIKLYIDEINRKSIYSNVEYYHPTFLYESILNIAIFIILLMFLFKFKKFKTGSVFLIYLMLYSLVRFFVEGIRIDSVAYVFNLPVAQVICIIIFLISIFCFIKINYSGENKKSGN